VPVFRVATGASILGVHPASASPVHQR
jgi:hypothetical protein